MSEVSPYHLRIYSVSSPYLLRACSVCGPYVVRLYRYGDDTDLVRSRYGTIAMPGRQKSMNIGYFSLKHFIQNREEMNKVR